MLEFILDIIFGTIMCFWNGYLIKWAIETFKCKNYVTFGAYCVLVYYNFITIANHFYFSSPVG